MASSRILASFLLSYKKITIKLFIGKEEVTSSNLVIGSSKIHDHKIFKKTAFISSFELCVFIYHIFININ